MGNSEKPREAGQESQGGDDKDARIAKLQAEVKKLQQKGAIETSALERFLKDQETEKRKNDWEEMGGRAGDHRIKKSIEEIGKNPDYFNSYETLRDAALRLAKEVSKQQDKFDWGKLIGGSAILQKAFSQDTLDTARDLAEIEHRMSVYKDSSRMQKQADRFAGLIKGAKNAAEREGHLKAFLKLHAALWEDKDAIAYLKEAADSIDNPAVKAAAKTAQDAIKHAPEMDDEYRRRLVLNFVDDVSKIRGAAAPAAPAAGGLPLALFRPGRESLRAEAEAGGGVGSSEAEGETAKASEPTSPSFTPKFFPAAGKRAPEQSAPAAAPERAPARPRMTDERRIQVMAKLGFPIDKVKAALNITSDKPSEIVAAIRKAQGDIWKTLSPDDSGKFRAAKNFADGIWGPESQRALDTIAKYEGVDKKWKDMYAALGGTIKQEVAASASPAKQEAAPQEAPETTALNFQRLLEKAAPALKHKEVQLARDIKLKGRVIKAGTTVTILKIDPKSGKVSVSPPDPYNTGDRDTYDARILDFNSKEIRDQITAYYKDYPGKLLALEAKWVREDKRPIASKSKPSGRPATGQVIDEEEPDDAAA